MVNELLCVVASNNWQQEQGQVRRQGVWQPKGSPEGRCLPGRSLEGPNEGRCLPGGPLEGPNGRCLPGGSLEGRFLWVVGFCVFFCVFFNRFCGFSVFFLWVFWFIVMGNLRLQLLYICSKIQGYPPIDIWPKSA